MKKVRTDISKTVCISGGMDPIHIGHIKYINEASRLGTLCVILNTDAFLINKKGYFFMPAVERKEILENIKGVDRVFMAIDSDQTVCKSLDYLKPDIFAKGGDKNIKNIPEVDICNKNNIEMVFGVGGNYKPQSSSWLIDRLLSQITNNKELRRTKNDTG